MITTITRAIKIIPMTATTATTPLKTPALTWIPTKGKTSHHTLFGTSSFS